MKIQPVYLEGKRVIVYPMIKEHVDELWEAGRKSPDIWNFMFENGESKQGMNLIVEHALNAKLSGKEFPFVVFDKELNRIIGSTRFLNISVPNCSLEIGWTWYDKEVWRTRVNTETKYLLLHHCFETQNLVRVQLKCDNRNERSKAAIQRIGAKFEGILRKDMILKDGYYRDTAYFSILQEEWASSKAILQDYLKDVTYIERSLKL